MFSIQCQTGRLVEMRIASPMSPDEMSAAVRHIHDKVERMPDKFVGVTDMRHAYVFLPAVVDGFIGLFSDNNPKLQRSAVLIGPSAIFGLQVERAIREAANPARKAFREVRPLEDWLGEVLSASERRRLSQFLAEDPLASSGPGKPGTARR